MLRIRLVEEAIADHYGEGEMRCPVHLSIGQEAAAVGVCETLALTDKVYSTHRCHAHYLAKGGDLNRMFAEICGKAAGCIGGRGGSMHLMDHDKGMMASIPIVSSSIPIAVGSALADKRTRSGKVTVAFFGDAAIEEGVFHESANFAALHKLPVVFVCENNLYSVYTPLRLRQPDRPLTEVARAHGMHALHGNGNDIEETFDLAAKAIQRARDEQGPTFLLLDTYRWREHCGPNFDNNIGYRDESEFKEWEVRCPVRGLRARIGDALTAERERSMTAELNSEIEAARAFARTAPLPDPSDASLHVYA
ncbi:MAG: thiamine pyrophosphate-dependent dehydrogenase E1 component subunit alpha [Rhodospirillales bacterium]|nr:thiamine pyrophosphate-dependent dehydrogenase E1 component subunit alpha [Rhodospirillales bacterium]